MKRILIIEDDRDIVELVRYNLANEGFQVSGAFDGTTGLTTLKKTPPDLLLLDLMLPKMSGLDICREVRKDESLNRLPILMLTARGDEADRVVGLEMGADDYVTKPFSPRELVARIKTILRRVQRNGGPAESALQIDGAAYSATLRGQRLDLTPVEFRLLNALANAPGRILSRANLLEQIYDDHRVVTDRTVDTHVKNLRRKMEQVSPGTDLIHSVYGVGYRLDA